MTEKLGHHDQIDALSAMLCAAHRTRFPTLLDQRFALQKWLAGAMELGWLLAREGYGAAADRLEAAIRRADETL